MENIRNFSIIAHIDHGKSSIADCLLQECGSVEERLISNQMMDTMDIEKERGITIKAQSARLIYKRNEQKYILNLIDTPGHVDFSYEVSRSLKSCEGALLVVDASQGIQAQTIANAYIAIENNLEIIPVINKIDLLAAKPLEVIEEIKSTLGIDCSNVIQVSAKNRIGIKELLNAIVDFIPPPSIRCSKKKEPLKAFVYDSWFDNYLGALGLVRVIEGKIQTGDNLKIFSTNNSHQVLSLNYPHPIHKIPTNIIDTGEIGILNLGLKNLAEIRVGDTITHQNNPTLVPLEGFTPSKPFVFAGIYPLDTNKFEDLRDSLNKLKLNDSSLEFEPETSVALGFGFRIGFLGLLHMEVVKERLEREFNLELIASAPSVVYEVILNNGVEIKIQNPSEFPDSGKIAYIKEPYVQANIITPTDFLGNIIGLLNNKRGIQKKIEYITQTRVMLTYELPSNEIIMDFYDKLKSQTKGYASFDYFEIGYKEGDLVKLDIRVSGEIVDALSIIVDRNKSYQRGKALVETMKEMIPKQLFEVAIQASIGNKVIARETVKSVGKNVTAKCYGGDITRKRKLLEKQKEGKKRMKAIGKVNIPNEAFLSILKID